MPVQAINGLIIVFIVLLVCTVYVGYLLVKYFKGKCEVLEKMVDNYREQEENYEELVRTYEGKVKLLNLGISERDKLIRHQDDYIKVLECKNAD